MNRLQHVVNQLSPATANSDSLKPQSVSSFRPSRKTYSPHPSDDDIVVVSAIRTAIGKAGKGSFKDTPPHQLLAPCLKYLIDNTGIDAKLVDDIVVGTVLAPGGLRASQCRMAAFLAGFPRETTLRTVNRQCSSGLQAIADVASAIQAGYINIGIGAGLEMMSEDRMGFSGNLSDDIKMNINALNCLMPMGITSEEVASRYGVNREKQDRFSVLSHQKAAQAKEHFRKEIIPISTRVKDPNSGKWTNITVIDDDGVRADTTYEGLAKLKPAFVQDPKRNPTTTAGNSSQVSDGASAVLLMKRSTAKQLGLKPRCRLAGFAVAGVDPSVMGVGPAFAIPKVLSQVGLALKDIDVFEINEAFASQAVYCVEKLGIDANKVNPNGGAIALGHPLGCTGARMTTSLLNEMERQGVKRGIVSMCIGSGMGAAAIYERI